MGEVCKVMKVVSQQILKGVLKSHAQQLDKWAPNCLGMGLTLVSYIQQLWMNAWWVPREGTAERGQAHFK